MTATLAYDPARLCAWTFNHDHWSGAEDIIRAVLRPRAKVAVKGCHSSSKTFAAADIILASLILGGDVITTAPTDDQVRGVLWRRVHDAIASSRIPLAEWGDVNQVEIRLPTGETAIGRSTNQGVRFHGYHARDGASLLIVVDESPGVLPAVFGAISGIRAGGDVRLLVLGNPLVPAGPFYDVFADPTWMTFTIDAFDTPNLAGYAPDADGHPRSLLALPDDEGGPLDDNVRPYLATRRWVVEKYREARGDIRSAEWLGRVRGQFALQGSTSLIWRTWLDGAKARPIDAASREPLTAGLDVAGPGEDETVLAIRCGGSVLHMEAWAQPDPRAEVIRTLKIWLHRGLRRVNVDEIGIGWYAYCDIRDALAGYGVGVRGINVGRPSAVLDERNRPTYANLKAEYAWHLREQFADGDVSGLVWDRAVGQLAAIQYGHDGQGRIAIESKQDARTAGRDSPDWAEALMLCFAPDDPRDGYAAAIGATGSMSR